MIDTRSNPVEKLDYGDDTATATQSAPHGTRYPTPGHRHASPRPLAASKSICALLILILIPKRNLITPGAAYVCKRSQTDSAKTPNSVMRAPAADARPVRVGWRQMHCRSDFYFRRYTLYLARGRIASPRTIQRPPDLRTVKSARTFLPIGTSLSSTVSDICPRPIYTRPYLTYAHLYVCAHTYTYTRPCACITAPLRRHGARRARAACAPRGAAS